MSRNLRSRNLRSRNLRSKCLLPRNLRSAAVLSIGLTIQLAIATRAQQAGDVGTSAGGNTAAANVGTSENRSWIARDPVTGRLFQQEVVSVSVPTTQWEVKPVTTTVYEPQSVLKSVPGQQTTFTPSTQYVMQPRVRGWWNPLRTPVQAYEYVPVTSWKPQTQTVEQQIATVQWVPKAQIVYVPQAVQKMQTQQQIVSRELPQPPANYHPSQTMLATQPKPLLTIPILAQQRILPWPTVNPTIATNGSYANAANPSVRSVVGSGLRPITSALAPPYSAPLQTASSSATAKARDAFQTGMAATILR